jgi:hypothetical protein
VPQLQTNQTSIPAHLDSSRVLVVRYKNWRGEVALRSIIPTGELRWGTTAFHPSEQWLLTVWDLERNDYREYALKDIEFTV